MESCERSIYSKFYSLFLRFAWALEVVALFACSSTRENNTLKVRDTVILEDTGVNREDGRSTLTDPWGPSIGASSVINTCEVVPGPVTLKGFVNAVSSAGGFTLVDVEGPDADHPDKLCRGKTLRHHIKPINSSK